MGAKLMVKKADQSQQVDLQSEVSSIGRNEDNTIPIDDSAASRHHAHIREEGGKYVLTDLGSLNGTLVNGEPVTGPRELRDGDVITIGTTNLVFSQTPTPLGSAYSASGPDAQATQAFSPSAPRAEAFAPRPAQPPAGHPTTPSQRPGPAGPSTSPAGAGRPTARVAGTPAAPVAKKSGSSKKIIIAILAILAVLLIACVVGVVLAFTQGWIVIE